MSLNLARNGFPEAVSRGAGGALRVATPCAASQTTVANSAQATPKPNARVPTGSPARVRLSLAFMRPSPFRSAAHSLMLPARLAANDRLHFERNHTVRLKG